MVAGGSAPRPRRRQEAHAEDCVLIPSDSSSESREPLVFEDAGDEAHSLGQQMSGEAKQVEFTLQRRGRDFVLRIGDKVAYKKAHVPKACYLGKVTQVDVALAQVSVRRYLPDASGLRVKWRLEFLDEEGSARKLDKGGYSFRDHVVRVEARDVAMSSNVIHIVEEVLSQLTEVQGCLSVWRTAEGKAVAAWLERTQPGRIQFWELFAGQAGLTRAAQQGGMLTAPPLDRLYESFGRKWDLSSAVDQEIFWGLLVCYGRKAIGLVHLEPCPILASLGSTLPRMDAGMGWNQGACLMTRPDQACSSCDDRTKGQARGVKEYIRRRGLKGSGPKPRTSLRPRDRKRRRVRRTKKEGQAVEATTRARRSVSRAPSRSEPRREPKLRGDVRVKVKSKKERTKKERSKKGIRLRSTKRTLLLRAKSQVRPPGSMRPPEPAVPPTAVRFRPAEHEWGSWVCSDACCRAVNPPEEEECHECGGENVVSRGKCYRCSTEKPRRARQQDDESSDSETEKRIEATLSNLPERRKRKRGGKKHNKKKVCKCGRTHHPSRGHKVPRTVHGVQPVDVIRIGLRKALVNRWWKRHFVPNKLRNKLQHCLNGNGSSVYVTARLLFAASLVPLAWKAEQEAEILVETVSNFAVRVVEEVEETTTAVLQTTNTVLQTTGQVVCAAVLAIGIGVLWWLGRVLANKLARSYHGNSLPAKLIELKDGESVWEITGSKGNHRVWMNRQEAACRAYLLQGNCGHIQAATDAAKDMGFLAAGAAVSFDEASVAARKGAAALKGLGRPSSPGPHCFSAMVEKAKGLMPASSAASSGSQEEVGCFALSRKKAAGGPLAALDKVAVGERAVHKLDAALTTVGSTDGSVCEVTYLKDDHAFVAFSEMARGLTSGSQVYLHEGLQLGSTERRGRHHGRSGQECEGPHRCGPRPGVGANQDTVAAKSVVFSRPTGEKSMIIGSCNWTTSSKSNREAGGLMPRMGTRARCSKNGWKPSSLRCRLEPRWERLRK
eukprot:Skav223204  [mRNA]  locus=scaffold1624:85544:91866:- [translate_table: standard]